GFAPGGVRRMDVAGPVRGGVGSAAHVFFHVDAPRIASDVLQASSEDDATLLVEDKALFNGRVDPRTRAATGSRLQLAVDPHRFHFFDPRTGKSLLAGSARPSPVAVPEPVLTTGGPAG